MENEQKLHKNITEAEEESYEETEKEGNSSISLLAPIFRTPQSSKKVDSRQKTPTPKRKRPNENNIEEVDESRGRTPSGQVLTGKVGDIKEKLQSKFPPQGHVYSPNSNSFNFSALSPLNTTQSAIAHRLRSSDQSVHDQSEHDEEALDVGLHADWKIVTPRNRNHQQQLRKIKEKQSQPAPLKEVSMKETNKSPQDHSEMETNQMVEQPATMDVRTVLKMFDQLKEDFKKEVDELRRDFYAVNTTGQITEESKEQASKAFNVITECEETMKQNSSKWAKQELQNKVHQGSISRLNEVVGELQKKIENLEIQNSRRMVVISGFYASEKKKTCRRQLENFFEQEMGIDVTVEDCYLMKQAIGQPNVVVTLQNYAEKREIFKNIYKIKDLKNKDGKKIYFNDYLLPAEYEWRKRQKDVRKENDELGDAKYDVSFKSRQIALSGLTLPVVVKVPDPTKILEMKFEEVNSIMELPLVIGTEYYCKGNRIVAASFCTNDLQGVNHAYMSVKLKYPAARHIVAVWNIPTDLKFDGQDFCDDQDHGVGRMILNMMIQSDISNRALFLIRHSGEKMNEDRISMYKKAAISVLEKSPINSVLNTRQEFMRPVNTRVMKNSGGVRREKPNRQEDETNLSKQNGSAGEVALQTNKKRYQPRQGRTFEPITEEEIEKEIEETRKGYAAAVKGNTR